MVTGFNPTVPIIAGLLDSIIEELGAKDRREHERRMKEFQLIESSSLKDEYARQLLFDRLLSPIEKAALVFKEVIARMVVLSTV